VTLPTKNKFNPALPIGDVADGICRPQQNFRDYLSKLDILVAALAAGGLVASAPSGVGVALINAANDGAAAAAGVGIGAFYRNGSIMMVRVA
jgi:hypothetical protein